MEVDAALLPAAWLVAGYLVLVPLLVVAWRSAPLQRLRQPELQHALLGSIVALIALWWIRAGVMPGLGFHFFGITVITLMFGWQFASLASLPVLLAGIATGRGDLPALGVNALLLFLLPVAVSWLLHRAAGRWLPPNFFVYVFIHAYLAAVVSMAAATFCMAGLQLAAGSVSASYLLAEYLPFLPMLLLAEGFINGAIIAVLVATRPGWVWTFDDRRYLSH